MPIPIPQIHFVTGKGGVGKSTIAAALGLQLAERGHKTLLVELGQRSFLADYLNWPQPSFDGHEISTRLSHCLWNGEDCLADYIKHLLKIPALSKLFLENPMSRSLLRSAPAIQELAILGKITSAFRKQGPPMNIDVIVVDAPATGHFLSMMRAPQGIARAVRAGPFHNQSMSILEACRNQGVSQVHIVTLLEEMPVQEMRELIEQLAILGFRGLDLIVNQCLPEISADISSLSQKNPRSQFLKMLNLKQNSQRELRRQLQEANALTLLPQVYSTDPKKIVGALKDKFLT